MNASTTLPPFKSLSITVLLLLAAVISSPAQIVTNLWHIPSNTTDIPGGISMRSPVSPGSGVGTTLYQGVWRNGGNNNQTGGTLYYRTGNSGAWSSVALSFAANNGDNQFWSASVTTGSPGSTLQYYFRVTFSNKSTTYLYTSGGVSAQSLTESDAQASPFSVTVGAAPFSLTVSSATTGALNADYTTTKLYIDELQAQSVPVTFTFNTGALNTAEAEVWTNLNNRDRADDDADADGIDDGIVPPTPPDEKPSGYAGGAYPANGYFQAIPLAGGNGTYSLTVNATKTGAYRLTARYRLSGNSTWIWYSSSGRRDHCITVAPQLARNLRIYEANVLNVDATGPTFAQRSTFESLTDNTRWNLDYLLKTGSNAIWFQPIHPNGIEGREAPGGTPYDPGSPYAVKNFFQVMEQMSQGNTRNASMAAFQNFVSIADTKGISIILDAPFNHTAFDCEIDQIGLNVFSAAGLNTSGWSATDKIKDREARFYSSAGGAGTAYSVPASSAGDVAAAPDRNDFGKWNDVKDVFFGRYATLVTGYPDADTSRNTVKIETDTIDMSSLNGAAGSTQAVTRGVWKYFASYVPYWLEKTGLPAGSSLTDQSYKGIDGLRADFGQGMPPQFWEYAINVARSHKWSFVFMTESLDGGEVTYRSNRHFELLNENIVFPFQSATTTTGYRDIFEGRRNAYGQGLVLLNNTSHDEAGYSDPWQAFIRYAVGSTIDGAPMVMYGQEIGTAASLSFDFYELNFGKSIPHFKRYNSMQPQWTAWASNTLGVANLIPAYSGVGLARGFSPALRSSNRWFLNPNGNSTADPDIFAVAKYQTSGASPATSDVVLAFLNLDRTNAQSNTFGIPTALADNMGLQSGRRYNVKNIAAYLGPNNEYDGRRDVFLWGTNGFTREDLVTNGVFVSLNPVPSTDGAWATAPFEAQYLKLYDVTPLPAPSSAPLVGDYALDGSVTFTWSPVVDAGGLTPRYRLTVTRSDSVVQNFETTLTSYTVTGIPDGVTATATVTTLNPNNTAIASSPTSASNPTRSLTSAGDNDNDGITNAAEVYDGTNPLDATSRLKVASVQAIPGSGFTLTWSTVAGRTYRVESRASLTSGDWSVLASGLTSGNYTDPAALTDKKFYRVITEP
ncbi:MAG: alpha-amylase family glycosyl hydrolase [Candidatus Methylacidiphilales bacterium]|nr:alpha-amylase family glycosyl hydrolase [Candidatus Methylacidiphilales bacterium]